MQTRRISRLNWACEGHSVHASRAVGTRRPSRMQPLCLRFPPLCAPDTMRCARFFRSPPRCCLRRRKLDVVLRSPKMRIHHTPSSRVRVLLALRFCGDPAKCLEGIVCVRTLGRCGAPGALSVRSRPSVPGHARRGVRRRGVEAPAGDEQGEVGVGRRLRPGCGRGTWAQLQPAREPRQRARPGGEGRVCRRGWPPACPVVPLGVRHTGRSPGSHRRAPPR